VTKLGFPGVQLRVNMPFGRDRRHTLLRLFAFPFLFTMSMVQLLWLLRKLRINVVNLHDPNDHGLYFAIAWDYELWVGPFLLEPGSNTLVSSLEYSADNGTESARWPAENLFASGCGREVSSPE
jgi:hypothetical protein